MICLQVQVEESHAYSGDAAEDESPQGGVQPPHTPHDEGQDSSADPLPAQHRPSKIQNSLVAEKPEEAQSPAWGPKSHAPDADPENASQMPGVHQGALEAESAGGAAVGVMEEFDGWDSDNNWGA